MSKLSIVGFVCLALIACSDKAVQSDSIYGKWKLMQYYYSIGGPGEWRQASSENTSFLEFKEDGKVTHSGPNIQTYSEGFRLSKDTIVFVRTSDEIKVKYELKNNTLRIFPPCIEGCGQAYVRFDGNEQ